MAYPGAVDSFTTKTDGVDNVNAADVNDLQTAIVNTETTLGTNPQGSAADLKTRLARSLDALGNLTAYNVSTLTIASGSVTPLYNRHILDTEGAAASDDLDTLTVSGAVGQGHILSLRIANDARKVVIRHNQGNIYCPGGQNITLSQTSQWAVLQYDNGLSKWVVLNPLWRFGDAANYAQFEADGTLVFKGNATYWMDVPPNGVSVGATGSNVPSFTAYSGNLRAYEFPGVTTLKEVFLQFNLPDSYKEGTDVLPRLHLYVPNDASGGVIKFYMEFAWANVDGVQPATATYSGTLTIGANAGNLHKQLVIDSTVVSGTGKTVNSVISCRMYRDPTDVADTFGSSVWLKSADVHIECDTLGSRTSTAK